MKNARVTSAGKPEEKRPLGSHGRRWKDNIKKNAKEMGREDVNWLHLTQDRVWSGLL
jgi:hypothetical protein